MTVKELIEKLKELDQEKDIYTSGEGVTYRISEVVYDRYDGGYVIE